MLIRLFGENYRSLRDSFELSFVAADLPTEEGRGVIALPISDHEDKLSVLRTIAIFGPNASGKSSVLFAANALRWLIRDSARHDIDEPLPYYTPFLFDDCYATKPISLGCTFWHADDIDIYEYKVSYSIDKIESESLYKLSNPEAPIFCRSGNAPVSGTLISENDKVRALVEQPRANATLFSFLAQLGPESGESSILPFYRSLAKNLAYHDFQNVTRDQRWKYSDRFNAHRLHVDSQYKEWVLKNLIKPADLGIEDISTEAPDGEEPVYREIKRRDGKSVQVRVGPPPRVRVEFEHSGKTKAKLGLEQESAGTIKMYNLAEYWHSLATEDHTLFVDELSASLHPLLLDNLIRALNSNSSNDRKSQMIFSTHDTTLLEARDNRFPALRRDQVYFTKKSTDGSSSLYSLAEFKERSEHNIRKRYLSNRYGAIPNISEFIF